MKEEILYLFFNKRMKQNEIAKKLNISKYKVSRVVTKDGNYSKEMQRRKEEHRKQHEISKKKQVYQKREMDRCDFEKVKQMHLQASIELSGAKNKISNRAFKKWNSSIYKYNKNKHSYVIKNGINAGSDVPKSIKW